MEYHLKVSQALDLLKRSASEQSATLLELGSLTVRFYAPHAVDRQLPHTRDEVYVVARGSATFRCCGKDLLVEQGDVLTVPAYQEHQFVNFTPDFATWFFFYGPEGSERTATACCTEPAETLTAIDLSGKPPAA